eukprot:Amastigsp_a843023_68.p3 type:complete len:168 gc:universal Amastigsp_a843023_68:192-695(+)
MAVKRQLRARQRRQVGTKDLCVENNDEAPGRLARAQQKRRHRAAHGAELRGQLGVSRKRERTRGAQTAAQLGKHDRPRRRRRYEQKESALLVLHEKVAAKKRPVRVGRVYRGKWKQWKIKARPGGESARSRGIESGIKAPALGRAVCGRHFRVGFALAVRCCGRHVR